MLPNTFPKAKTAKQMTEQRQNLAVSFYKNSQEVQDPGNQIVRRTSNLPLASFTSYLREAQTEANLGITVFRQTYPYITPLRSLYPVRQRDWVPTDLGAPLSLWLDGADRSSMVVSGSSVNRWNDKSGSGYNMTPMNDSPVLSSLNGLGAVRIGVTADRGSVRNTSIPIPTSYSIFAIVERIGGGATYQYIAKFNAFDDSYLLFGSVNGNYATFAGQGTGGGQTRWWDLNANSPTFTFSSPAMVAVINNSSLLFPYTNGTGQNTKTGSTNPTTGIVIGSEHTGGQTFNGNFGEILFFSRDLTTTERQQVEGYLAWKWGLVGTLPANHPYKNAKLDPVVINYL